MGKPVLYMSMFLDGVIAGPHDGPGNGLGNGGHLLHEWLGEPVSSLPRFDPPGLSGQVFAELMATRAVMLGSGRRLFGADRVALDLTCVLDAPCATHLHYGVAT